MATTYRPHWINLDGVSNMRDLGGIATDDGRHIKPSTLIRSDNLSDLPEESIRILVDSYELRDVSDLRTEIEVAESGFGPLTWENDVHFHQMSLYPAIGKGDKAPWLEDEDLLHPEASSLPRGAVLAKHYFGYLVGRPDSVIGGLRTIANAPHTVLVNCAAGKDRTGTLIGVVLATLGVPREIVAADYEISNLRVPAILKRMGISTAAAGGAHSDDDMTTEGQSTPAEAMTGLLDKVDAEYGSIHGYLEANGWSKADQKALENKLLDA